ncbi:CATRA system-associated protein [Streptomyces specialis]|uniref:CATRA system-associated protein n=1 Tax=Streptomyces specialis TaxID=498367 RepID=UPI00073EBB43|nr:CATRA system-associated protein [Streptomyces specialis]
MPTPDEAHPGGSFADTVALLTGLPDWSLPPDGWADVDALLDALARARRAGDGPAVRRLTAGLARWAPGAADSPALPSGRRPPPPDLPERVRDLSPVPL